MTGWPRVTKKVTKKSRDGGKLEDGQQWQGPARGRALPGMLDVSRRSVYPVVDCRPRSPRVVSATRLGVEEAVGSIPTSSTKENKGF